MVKNYYKTLGLQNNATSDEIRTAYRKKVLEYHPDKNLHNPRKAQKFVKVQEAYEVLSDSRKRSQYDYYRSFAPTSESSESDSEGPDNNNNNNSGSGSSSQEVPPAPPPQRPPTPPPPIEVPPLEIILPCTLEELHFGGIKTVEVERMLSNGAKDVKTFEVNVEKGFRKGNQIKFEKEGGVREGFPNDLFADLIFIVSELPHVIFTRSGAADLKVDVTIDLRKALLGDSTITVRTITGRTLNIPLTGITNNGRTFRKCGLGLFNRETNTDGDLIITVLVKVPKELSEHDRLLVKKMKF